jgi:P-type E1-E2 ATPase
MRNILIKNAESLERMEKVDTLVVDKTGTLPQGKPAVVAVETTGSREGQKCCALPPVLERSSEHLALAIVRAAEEEPVHQRAQRSRPLPSLSRKGSRACRRAPHCRG